MICSFFGSYISLDGEEISWDFGDFAMEGVAGHGVSVPSRSAIWFRVVHDCRSHT